MQYITTINGLIDKYMPLNEMTQKEIKQQYKPWINNQIRKMITERERLLKKYIQTKNPITKDELHKSYKELRNKIRDITRQSRKKFIEEYFSKNIKNIKNT